MQAPPTQGPGHDEVPRHDLGPADAEGPDHSPEACKRRRFVRMGELDGAARHEQPARQSHTEGLPIRQPRSDWIQWRVIRVVEVPVLDVNRAPPDEPGADRERGIACQLEPQMEHRFHAGPGQSSVVVSHDERDREAAEQVPPQRGAQSSTPTERRCERALGTELRVDREIEGVPSQDDLRAGVTIDDSRQLLGSLAWALDRQVQVTHDEQRSVERRRHWSVSSVAAASSARRRFAWPADYPGYRSSVAIL